jgi:hypothetical protein
MEREVSQNGTMHALPGRLRVKVAGIKKSPQMAAHVEQVLRQEPGVATVGASPVTGSVLVHFDPSRTCSAHLLKRLEPYGLPTTPVSSSLSEFSSELSSVVCKELVKMALTSMIPVGPVEVLCALI